MRITLSAAEAIAWIIGSILWDLYAMVPATRLALAYWALTEWQH